MVKAGLRCATACFLSSLLAAAAAEPLDPLTAAERRAAEKIATEDARTRELLGAGRTRLVYSEFVALKPDASDAVPPAKEPEIVRAAEVVFYRYDNDSGVRAVVDLRRGAVAGVTKLEGSSVPLAREDLAEAARIALADPQVAALLGPQAATMRVLTPDLPRNPESGIRALLVHAASDADPCWKRRCVHLFFLQKSGYLTDSVVVDLTERRVSILRGMR